MCKKLFLQGWGDKFGKKVYLCGAKVSPPYKSMVFDGKFLHLEQNKIDIRRKIENNGKRT
jgi:hypothetical protein